MSEPSAGGSWTDREAFKSAFRQSRRNVPFFVGQAYLVSFLPDLLGVVGSVIAAVSAILSLVFTAQALFVTILGLFSLITWPFRPAPDRQSLQPGWVALGILLTTFDAAVYAACFYFVSKAAHWWGLL